MKIMDTFLLRVHQRQILHQCHAALFADEQVKEGLAESNQELFWAAMQNFLTATANISKSCWGQGGRLIQERESLRTSLEISDDSPLANTDLRNHLEHYDERLDRWYESSQNKNYADFIIGPTASSIVGLESTDIFRHFDPDTREVIFWGEHYFIPELVKAVIDLLPTASRESSKPHWEV